MSTIRFDRRRRYIIFLRIRRRTSFHPDWFVHRIRKSSWKMPSPYSIRRFMLFSQDCNRRRARIEHHRFQPPLDCSMKTIIDPVPVHLFYRMLAIIELEFIDHWPRSSLWLVYSPWKFFKYHSYRLKTVFRCSSPFKSVRRSAQPFSLSMHPTSNEYAHRGPSLACCLMTVARVWCSVWRPHWPRRGWSATISDLPTVSYCSVQASVESVWVAWMWKQPITYCNSPRSYRWKRISKFSSSSISVYIKWPARSVDAFFCPWCSSIRGNLIMFWWVLHPACRRAVHRPFMTHG